MLAGILGFCWANPCKGRAFKTDDAPISFDVGAQCLVKTDGWRIPVQHGPFHTGTLAFRRLDRDFPEQVCAQTLAACSFAHEQVFKMQDKLPFECRQLFEIKGKPFGLTSDFPDQDFCGGMSPEEKIAQLFFIE